MLTRSWSSARRRSRSSSAWAKAGSRTTWASSAPAASILAVGAATKAKLLSGIGRAADLRAERFDPRGDLGRGHPAGAIVGEVGHHAGDAGPGGRIGRGAAAEDEIGAEAIGTSVERATTTRMPLREAPLGEGRRGERLLRARRRRRHAARPRARAGSACRSSAGKVRPSAGSVALRRRIGRGLAGWRCASSR